MTREEKIRKLDKIQARIDRLKARLAESRERIENYQRSRSKS